MSSLVNTAVQLVGSLSQTYRLHDSNLHLVVQGHALQDTSYHFVAKLTATRLALQGLCHARSVTALALPASRSCGTAVGKGVSVLKPTPAHTPTLSPQLHACHAVADCPHRMHGLDLVFVGWVSSPFVYLACAVLLWSLL